MPDEPQPLDYARPTTTRRPSIPIGWNTLFAVLLLLISALFLLMTLGSVYRATHDRSRSNREEFRADAYRMVGCTGICAVSGVALCLRRFHVSWDLRGERKS